MTTIAYNHKDKEIAVDSRMTRDGRIISDVVNKIITTKRGTFVLAGLSADCYRFADNYPFFEKQLDCYGFAIIESSVYWVSFSEGELCSMPCEYNESAGSGQDHAITALDLGLSAYDAVKLAIKRDCNSGGEIKVLNIK